MQICCSTSITSLEKGGKVEAEGTNLSHSVMLAFNLELNKNGNICQRRIADFQ